MNGLKKFLKAFEKPICGSCKKKQTLQFQGKDLEVRQAPEPELVIWENQYVTRRQNCCKGFLIYFLSTIILFATLGGIYGLLIVDQMAAVSTDAQGQWESCGDLTYTIKQAMDDYLLPKNRQNGVVECYCRQEFYNQG